MLIHSFSLFLLNSLGQIIIDYALTLIFPMLMNLIQIKAFLWITRLGSFAAAAERLNITQPTISLRIKELEAQLGVLLFDRTGRRAQLTERGQALVAFAEEMEALDQTIRRNVGNPAILAGNVRVGVAELVAQTWLASLLEKLNQQHPNVSVSLEIELTQDLWEKFDRRALDVILLPGPIDRSNLECISLGSVEFSWMAHSDLDIHDGILTPADLAKHPAILLSTQSNLHLHVENWYRDAGVRLNRLAMCNSLRTIATLTLKGLGVSTLPPAYYADEIATGGLRRLETLPALPNVDYWAVFRALEKSTLADIVAGLAKTCTTFPQPDN